jgi:hypothetical protein
MHSATPDVTRRDEIDLAQDFRKFPPTTSSDTAIEMIGRFITVPDIGRNVTCKIASKPSEWEEAFRLVAESYRARGYEATDSPAIRFTPYNGLPDTVTLVAQSDGQLVATLSLVFDNLLLGLPMECIYGEEINDLRRKGRRLVEVTGLADNGLSLREFLPVFVTLMRLLAQYTIHRGYETWVITINPRHRIFYRKALGFVPFGPWRSYPTVQNHPAEAYWLDPRVLKSEAPEMHEKILGQPVPAGVLRTHPMPIGLLHHFANLARQADRRKIQDVLAMVEEGEPDHRRW